ncbi:MAG: hypothetical protein ACRCZS_03345 [Chroococcidiopsis sp.]
MCKQVEPLPTEFYAEQGLFSEADMRSLGANYLGDRIYTPGFTQLYQVTSGPLCRIYWNNGKPEPHSFESAWQEVDGKWTRAGPNFLSYQVKASFGWNDSSQKCRAGDYFITPRWKPSLPEYWQLPRQAA